jgi:hypothetical protein
VSAARKKGTAAETTVVDHLRAAGWPHAERRALNSSKDRGDVAGIPGVVLEVKSGARLALPEWLRETEIERANDGATYGLLVIKPKGVGATKVDQWPVVLPLAAMVRLLKEAGY